MMIKKMLSVPVIILLGLSVTVFSVSKNEYPIVKIGSGKGVIIPAEDGRKFYWQHGYEAESYWTPAKEDVIKAERRLAAYLKKTKPEASPDLFEELHGYNRLYVGVIIKGSKVIWLKFIRKEATPPNWISSPSLTVGGGSKYFTCLYSTNKEEFIYFYINTRAEKYII